MAKLAFYELVVPDELKADHVRCGGRSLRRFAADLDDGQLRVIAGYEPWHSDGAFRLHLSTSVGKPFDLKAFRAATDEELRAVMANWPRVLFEEDNEGRKNPFVRNLWEV